MIYVVGGEYTYATVRGAGPAAHLLRPAERFVVLPDTLAGKMVQVSVDDTTSR